MEFERASLSEEAVEFTFVHVVNASLVEEYALSSLSLSHSRTHTHTHCTSSTHSLAAPGVQHGRLGQQVNTVVMYRQGGGVATYSGEFDSHEIAQFAAGHAHPYFVHTRTFRDSSSSSSFPSFAAPTDTLSFIIR